MILLHYHAKVTSPNYPSFVSYGTLGKVFKIHANSVRKLIYERFEELSDPKILTHK
jgi:hypothetical protein